MRNHHKGHNPHKVTPLHISVWSRVEYDQDISKCWEWKGYLRNGYGVLGVKDDNGKWPNRKVHRVTYSLAYGEIPDKMLVMHTCDNRKCCNPSHLRLGTYLDNNRDMYSKGRSFGQRKTHCSNGHEFTEENTYRPKNSPYGRQCRACSRMSSLAAQRKKRANKG